MFKLKCIKTFYVPQYKRPIFEIDNEYEICLIDKNFFEVSAKEKTFHFNYRKNIEISYGYDALEFFEPTLLERRFIILEKMSNKNKFYFLKTQK